MVWLRTLLLSPRPATHPKTLSASGIQDVAYPEDESLQCDDSVLCAEFAASVSVDRHWDVTYKHHVSVVCKDFEHYVCMKGEIGHYDKTTASQCNSATASHDQQIKPDLNWAKEESVLFRASSSQHRGKFQTPLNRRKSAPTHMPKPHYQRTSFSALGQTTWPYHLAPYTRLAGALPKSAEPRLRADASVVRTQRCGRTTPSLE